jgi:GNAT superfamily N-acetyltransferase
MRDFECQTPHCGGPPSIVLEAMAREPNSDKCNRDIVVLSEPLTEPQWKMLRAFVSSTSRESLRLRFGQTLDFTDDRTFRRLFGIAGQGEEMLWMLDQGGSICGVVHLVRLSPTHAEIALIVRSDRARRGIGERLLRSALARASREGLLLLSALVLYENIPMLRLARKVGFEPCHSLGLTVGLKFDLGRFRRNEGGACAYATLGGSAGV